ncbi:calcium/sodium antiporter [Roseospira navarrensis]|uniref:Calcium/sodium antiporter n=1 Tax=Roseospira navarrensis TaxID=140058 RepID=A0A7X1ZCI7_9PROT|nr:calcium/sodium antiporter [Roseospira navarrensis]MQX36050.1 calcium/sodium antiporter [Roseospira navarrensis]
MSIVFLIAGVVLLPVGSNRLVSGAVALSERLGISPLVVALTVVAFGTSLPELVVCVQAALSGSPGIAVGNVVGSNIANILLILGAAALLKPIACDPKSVTRDGLIMVAATALFVVLALAGLIPRWQGGIMLALLVAYVLFSYWRESSGKDPAEGHLAEVEEFEGLKNRPWSVIVGAILLGLVGVVAGAHLLVTGAVDIARVLGVSEEVIGLTMVALGTSLPELAVAVAAAYKGHSDVALGNVVGSNIFNILAILGATAVVVPIEIPPQILRFDLWAMSAFTLVLIPIMLTGRRIGRAEAGLFLVAYAGYTAIQYVGVDRILGVPAGI